MILSVVLEKTFLLPIYVTGIGSHTAQREIYRPEGLDSYQILFCTGGAGVLEIDGKSYPIQCGDGFFFRPEVPHNYYSESGNWKTQWVVFDGSGVDNILEYLGFGGHEVFSLHRVEDMEIRLREISDLFRLQEPEAEIKTSLLMYKLLIRIWEHKNQTVRMGGMTNREKYEKLSPVIELMQKEYAFDLSLSDMAECIGITEAHLCRLFHQVYDTTPMKYLTHLRISMAKRYLSSSPEYPVKKIANMVGFKDAGYFASVFKKAEGILPGEYRKQHSF